MIDTGDPGKDGSSTFQARCFGHVSVPGNLLFPPFLFNSQRATRQSNPRDILLVDCLHMTALLSGKAFRQLLCLTAIKLAFRSEG